MVVGMVLGVALLVTYAVMFYEHHLSSRTSVLYYSLAFLSLGIANLLPNTTFLSGFAVFSAFFWLGTVTLSEELMGRLPYSKELKYVAATPLAALLFFSPINTLLSAIIIAIPLLLSSAILWDLKYRELRLTSLVLLIWTILAVAFPFSEELYIPQGILSIVLAYLIISATAHTSFLGTFSKKVPEEVSRELKPGVIFMEAVPKEILKNALVFSRRPGEDETWFWMTKVRTEGKKTIEPTNLPKMLDMAVKFMKGGGVVVIDGIDYLILENGLDTVLKFLAHLRDHALVSGSTVVLVGNLSSLGERERIVLKRILGEEP
ncbi:DUF835 domain-containing protein [Pyrococcus yayanosii]|uniref:DUF835 domain-containing protein n=1 Tax=Pyrococcus yayanosii (strain CH1 / JCM 16557) TaxID=529709 RepID=F8AIW9_PYRYC|nr:DUF835 domain-containing protein [Pyrococcus yayanosii]AEH24444.1 hypothetical protein PYCH_07570 [Pyrococcus yayanosii CH1]